MNILFIYTNFNGFHVNTYHFGLGYLSSVLKNNGFHTKLAILQTKKDYRKLDNLMSEFKPAIVGFTSVSSQYVFISELARIIKKRYKSIIVCGGVHPTIFPECLLSSPYLDGLFIGESEFPFLEFAQKVNIHADYQNVDNFCYVRDNKLIKNRLRQRIVRLESLPFPDREIYDYQSVINTNNGIVTVLSSRGCPFNCSYCANHALAGVYGADSNNIRHNSIEKVIEEIETIEKKYVFRYIYFVDDLFISNREWLTDLLTKYKLKVNKPFICHIRPNVCSRAVLKDLKNAGCFRIFVAVESANENIRNKIMKRNITIEQLENTFRWANEVGLETQSVNIIGIPGETEESIRETIDFNRRMKPTLIGVNIFSPYEGTELGDYCKENGLLRKLNPHSFLDRRQSRLNLPSISDRNLMRLFRNFEYLVYKDISPHRAMKAYWRNNYEYLKGIILIGLFFRKFESFARFVFRIIT